MHRIAKGTIIAVIGAVAMSAAALADTKTKTAAASKPATTPTLTTGSINVDPPFAQRMKDCMAIWDKGTHMNKEQWRRSCQTTLRSLTTE